MKHISGDVWYWSDLHIGHKLVAGIRGHRDDIFIDGLDTWTPNPDKHDAWLADLWDSTVKDGDQVFLVGDMSINGGQHALDWIEKRPGRKHLIAGNHDPVHPSDRRSPRLQRHWLGYFETIQPFLRRKLNGKQFLMSHFPYAQYGDGVRAGSRFEQYRLPDLGLPLVHGHTHDKDSRAYDRSFHVGVDAWRDGPVPQGVIQEWLEGLPADPRTRLGS